MLRLSIVLASFVVGCGSFAATPAGDERPTPTPDAAPIADAAPLADAADGAPAPCVARAAATSFFRADFDDGAGARNFFVLGGPLQAPSAAGNMMLSYGAPASTLPYAMLLSSAGDPYLLEATKAVTGGVCTLHAEFDLEFRKAPDGSLDGALLAELGVRDGPGGFDHCYVALQYAAGPGVILQSHCGNPDVNRSVEVIGGTPGTVGGPSNPFRHFTFDVDLHIGRATIRYDAAAAVVLDLETPTTLRGGIEAHAAFGMGAPKTGSLAGMQVRFDSITVDVR